MTERGILFSAPMVQAILDGRKTQTRRVFEPSAKQLRSFPPLDMSKATTAGHKLRVPSVDGETVHSLYPPIDVGDVLYVCETHYRFGYWKQNGLTETGKPKWRFIGVGDDVALFDPPPQFRVSRDPYSPSKPQWYRRLGRFMFARHARIHLRVTGVKVERLQDISEADAVAEGISVLPMQSADDPSAWWQSGPGLHQDRMPRGSFGKLWNSINGPDAWDANLWVAAYTFERIK